MIVAHNKKLPEMPPGYKLQPASCGNGYVVMHYDGAWQAMRDENGQPLIFGAVNEAVSHARFHQVFGGSDDESK